MSSSIITSNPATYPGLSVPTSIDYTSKDWQSLVNSMLAYAAVAMPEWNTNSEGDFGVAMIELFAYGLDILSYYGDRIGQEAYLPTATQRVNILNIAETLGYVPSNGAPSSGTVTFVTDNPGNPVLVPNLTQVVATPTDGSAPVIFETQESVVVDGNGGTNSVEVLQGVTYTLVAIGTSDGTPGQQFALPQLGVLTDTVQVFVQDDSEAGNQEWLPVAYLIDSAASDAVFSVYTDSSGTTWVQFGDNINGMTPGIGLNIWASFRVGSGSSGNLPAGSVSAFVTPIQGVQIALLEDGVTPDTSAMTGGADPETNDQIRTNASLANTAQLRAVNPQDVANLALMVPGVLLANAVANHSTSVSLYVTGPNYTAPGPALVDSILTFFEGKTMCGMTISVVDPDVILIDVGTTANPVQLVVLDGYIQSNVVQNVTAALQAFLSPPNVGFGQLINVSGLYETILAVAGVAYCVIPVFTREDATQTDATAIQLRPGEIPSPGEINLSTTGGIT